MIWRVIQNPSPGWEHLQAAWRACSLSCAPSLPSVHSKKTIRTSLFCPVVVSFTLKLLSVEQDGSSKSLDIVKGLISCYSAPEIMNQPLCELQRVQTVLGRGSWSGKGPQCGFEWEGAWSLFAIWRHINSDEVFSGIRGEKCCSVLNFEFYF